MSKLKETAQLLGFYGVVAQDLRLERAVRSYARWMGLNPSLVYSLMRLRSGSPEHIIEAVYYLT